MSNVEELIPSQSTTSRIEDLIPIIQPRPRVTQSTQQPVIHHIFHEHPSLVQRLPLQFAPFMSFAIPDIEFENVQVPLDPEILCTLPIKVISTQDVESHNTCAICMSEFESGEQVRTLRCNHDFHLPCIDRWLLQDTSCPLCRHDQREEYEE